MSDQDQQPDGDVGLDQEFQKLLGAQQAAVQQAIASVRDFAALVSLFRTQLIIGGFPAEKAEDMAGDYFNAVLDTFSPGRADRGED